MLRPVLCLITLIFVTAVVQAAPPDDQGEVRLWVRATYTGIHTLQSKQIHGGELPAKIVDTRNDRLTLTFTGTSTWRVEDWVPGPPTSNCIVTAEGGGSFSHVDKGATGCLKHKGSSYLKSESGKWTYLVPPKPEHILTPFSPAGTVMILPNGVWRLVLLCYPNADAVEPKGNWTQRYVSCCGNQRDDYVVDRENEVPLGHAAMTMAIDAFNETLGGTDGQSVDGTWDLDKKGFFASGRVHNTGGEPNITLGGDPTGIPGEDIYSGNESRHWIADIQWTISYTLKPPPVECIIEPDGDYAKWLPQGGANEQSVGNRLGISARLQVKGQPGKTPLQKGQFRFQLVNSSNEPGVALNLPLQGAKSDPDLKFQESGGMQLKDEGRTAESAATDLKDARAELGCYDYGAFGKVRVICQLTDGSVVYGHLEGQPGKEELSIPRDDDDNHLADLWERQEGVSGKGANWDGESEPALDGTPGDGLSLYEEYRGLAHQGKSLRLLGSRKDLIIANEMGARAKAGLSLFESASGIHVAELEKAELSPDRVVNTNSGLGYLGPQCGLRLVTESLPEGIIGMSFPDMTKTSPVDCDRTAMNSNLSFIPGQALTEVLAMSLAHELGHSLGAQHHGDSGSGTTFADLVISDATTKIVGVNNAPITQRPYTLAGLIETKVNGSESSGAEDCVMRNSSYFQWVKRVNRMGEAAYYAAPPTALGRSFCQSSAGSGINAADHQPISYFGNCASGRGSCLARLRVRDQ